MTNIPLNERVVEILTRVNTNINDTLDTGFFTQIFRTNETLSGKDVISLSTMAPKVVILPKPQNPEANNPEKIMNDTGIKDYLRPPKFDLEDSIGAQRFIDGTWNDANGSREDNASQRAFTEVFGTSYIRLLNIIGKGIEYLSAQALLYGKISINGSGVQPLEVDYRRNASHNITPTTPWSNLSSSTPVDDLAGACDLIYHDGKLQADIVLMGKTALRNFMNSAQVQKLAESRRIDLININGQPNIGVISDIVPNSSASLKVVGTVTAGTTPLTICSYDDVYVTPEWMSSPGTIQTFLGGNEVLLFSSGIVRGRSVFLTYAGLPYFDQQGTLASEGDISIYNHFNLNTMPRSIFLNVSLGVNRRNLDLHIESRPLPIIANPNATALLTVA